MVRTALFIAAGMFAVAWTSLAMAAPEAATPPPDENVARLIAELGDDQYAVRRRAEEELIRLGPDAFDQLKAAVDAPDLEISERVRYILERLRVEWVRPEDTPEVRRVLSRYGELSDPQKYERIALLASLEGGEGLAALCRIARLDRSPLIARRAALTAVDRDRPTEGPFADPQLYAAELGASTRPAVEWARSHLLSDASPADMAARWNEFANAELALLEQSSPETDITIVVRLLDHHLNLCNELEMPAPVLSALVRIIDFIDEQVSEPRDVRRPGDREAVSILQAWGVDPESENVEFEGINKALRWTLARKRWDVVVPLQQRYGTKLEKSRSGLYLLAAAQAAAGRTDEAAKLADRAFELEDEEEDARLALAGTLAQLGRVDWAEREFRRTIEKNPQPNWRSMKARYELAAWLFDRQEYQQAADLMGEFAEDLSDSDKKRLMEEVAMRQRAGRSDVDLPTFTGRWQYYLSFHHGARGEHDEQQLCLERAVASNAEDPDILIAMYRVPEADEAFRQRTREMIRAMSDLMLQVIEESGDRVDANSYNIWAWLVGNTEGDYAKAVEFSKRSLELSPDEPSFLDTLGRCYYAAGDLENAVKSQRRAVELAPHYGVMRRQLELFERELKAGKPKP